MPEQQPPLLGTARPLGQFAAARLGALLYRVNKVSGVSVARGIGDRLTATSSSPDKMHSFNGVFRPAGVCVLSSHYVWPAVKSIPALLMLCVASCVYVCVCTHISILDVCTLYTYVSSPLVRLIFHI